MELPTIRSISPSPAPATVPRQHQHQQPSKPPTRSLRRKSSYQSITAHPSFSQRRRRPASARQQGRRPPIPAFIGEGNGDENDEGDTDATNEGHSLGELSAPEAWSTSVISETDAPAVTEAARTTPMRTMDLPILPKPQPQSQVQIQTPTHTSMALPLNIILPTRSRSNSDSTAATSGTPQLGSAKRSLAAAGRKSLPTVARRNALDVLMRDGPAEEGEEGGKEGLEKALAEMRYLILSSGVDADGDGMSANRIYIWMALLNVPPMPTDEYLALVHRGRSPAYSKIRNDTFRTLATDPLFKRRVTEASLIRLLNATAWRIHDMKEESKKKTDSESQPEEQAPIPTTASSEPLSSSAPEPAIYIQGMNVLSAPLLYATRSESEAFALFTTLLTRILPSYTRPALDGVHAGLALLDRCLAAVDPLLASHLHSRGLTAELYAFPSVLTLCACTPPLPEVLKVWDFLFAFGCHLNVLVVVAQLVLMRDVLLASESPNKLLRSFPALNAKEIIALTVYIAQKIPEGLYAELVNHTN